MAKQSKSFFDIAKDLVGIGTAPTKDDQPIVSKDVQANSTIKATNPIAIKKETGLTGKALLNEYIKRKRAK